MDYTSMIEKIKVLEFIGDEQTADAAIKAVLGTFASRMREEPARKFTDDLPEPLNYDKLRGHQINVTAISLTQFINSLEKQFKINTDQAQSLVRKVLRLAKDSVPERSITDWEAALPPEWAAVIDNA